MMFYIVDAFTEELFGGNPAGVVILGEEDQFPSDETMRLVAAEMRYSETAFVKQLDKSTFNTRYFTPEAEVDLCGHATIATFHTLAEAGLIEKTGEYLNKTLAGDLQVRLNDGVIFMEMGEPKVLGGFDAEQSQELYQVLGIPDAFDKTCEVLIPENVSTGLPDILIPVADEATLHAIKPNFSELSDISDKYKVVGVHAFTLNGEDGQIHCRNFAPLYGIDEEAATGTANGALTYYLYRKGLIASDVITTYIQGEAMNRPSRVVGKVEKRGDQVEIYIGGRAIILAEGELHISRRL